MNGANRQRKRTSYRQRAYRRRKIKYILAISTLALAALFVIFLVIGNILDRKIENKVSGLDDLGFADRDPADTDSDVHSVPESLFADPTALSATGSSLDSRLAAISSRGTRAACFELDDESGALLYSSPTAQALGYQSSGNDLWRLDSAMSKFDASGLYSIGITHVTGLDGGNDLARSAAIGYHSALIAEALRAGVDEVLIVASDTALERTDELIRLAQEVHRFVPEGKIGLALSYPLPEYPNDSDEFSDELLVTLWESFEVFALDICKNSSTAEEAEAHAGELLYYVLRYNMRILIPTEDATLSSELTEMCKQRGFTNVQLMP